MKALHDLRLPLQFILTGSSSLDIRLKTAEPLTGRKQVFHVAAFSFAEYLRALGANIPADALAGPDGAPYVEELSHHLDSYTTYGGYPAVVLSREADKRLRRLEEIVTSYLEKDIAAFLRVENLTAYRRLMALLAAQQGGLVNVQELSGALGIHRETVARYLDFLEHTFVIRRVPPWFRNPRTELTSMPKVYFADAGLRNLALGAVSSLRERPDRGAIVEGAVAAELARRVAPGARLGFWRTRSGAEVDFVVSDAEPRVSVEVKSGPLARPTVSRGYRSFLDHYAPPEAWLLNRDRWKDERVGPVTLRYRPVAAFLASPPASLPSP